MGSSDDLNAHEDSLQLNSVLKHWAGSVHKSGVPEVYFQFDGRVAKRYSHRTLMTD